MAIKEYVGAIIMEIDGREVEVQDLDVTENTGMIPVKTMNRSRVIAGVARGIMEWAMRVTVVIPFNDHDLAVFSGRQADHLPGLLHAAGRPAVHGQQ